MVFHVGGAFISVIPPIGVTGARSPIAHSPNRLCGTNNHHFACCGEFSIRRCSITFWGQQPQCAQVLIIALTRGEIGAGCTAFYPLRAAFVGGVEQPKSWRLRLRFVCNAADYSRGRNAGRLATRLNDASVQEVGWTSRRPRKHITMIY